VGGRRCGTVTTKEFLQQAYRIDQRINSKLEQIMSLRELATKATSTLSDMPRSESPNLHRMEDIIAKMVDLESEINADVDTLVDLKREIVTVIKQVENSEYQTLLELKYLCFKKWEEIAIEMSRDLRWVYRLHDKALNEVDNVRH
jgi:hypothetical protein